MTREGVFVCVELRIVTRLLQTIRKRGYEEFISEYICHEKQANH